MRPTDSWGRQWALLLLAVVLLAHVPSESESFLMEPRRILVLSPTTKRSTGMPHHGHLHGRFDRPSLVPAVPTTVRRTRGADRCSFRRVRALLDTPAGEAASSSSLREEDHLAVNGEGTSLMKMTMEDLAQQLSSATDLAPLSDGADLVQPLAPPLSYDKFLKMQDKRVVVTIRYSGESGLRPYFLTVAKKLKASHPDVVIERRILPSVDKDGTNGGEAVFEIVVDGKVVIGKKNRTRRQRVSMDLTRSRSVYVSMQEMDVAISRARRRRRPTTAYGGTTD